MKANTSIQRRSTRVRKPLLMKANEQYCLDFGQKNIDPIRCPTCGMLYIPGEESDEKQHAKHHAEFDCGIKWQVKLERVKKYFDDCSRVISIISTDPKPIIDAINKLLKLSDGEMSAGDDVLKILNKPQTKFFIYVDKQNHIAGYVCVEPISEAHELVNYEASRLEGEPIKAECGVLYLWVHPSYRRQRIATKLVDVARANLREKGIIHRFRVAVCDPTESAVPFFTSFVLNKRRVKVYQQE